MNIETVLIKYQNVINYEVSRVLYENIDLWDEAIQESFIRINASLESILEKEVVILLFSKPRTDLLFWISHEHQHL